MGKNIGVKFTKDGPSVPVEVLRALEAGELVIFCGAGVSRQCGLPDFSGLVDSVCGRLSRPMEEDERELFEANAFDAAIGLIESRIGRSHLRGAVRSVLELTSDADFSTHQALLQLAVSKQGRLRLVTTNFDRAFELCPFRRTRMFDYAPYLPMPAQSWNSIVHVHGEWVTNGMKPMNFSSSRAGTSVERTSLRDGLAGFSLNSSDVPRQFFLSGTASPTPQFVTSWMRLQPTVRTGSTKLQRHSFLMVRKPMRHHSTSEHGKVVGSSPSSTTQRTITDYFTKLFRIAPNGTPQDISIATRSFLSTARKHLWAVWKMRSLPK